jgi:hypothetical protein
MHLYVFLRASSSALWPSGAVCLCEFVFALRSYSRFSSHAFRIVYELVCFGRQSFYGPRAFIFSTGACSLLNPYIFLCAVMSSSAFFFVFVFVLWVCFRFAGLFLFPRACSFARFCVFTYGGSVHT